MHLAFFFFWGGHVCVLFKNKNSSSYFFFFLQSNKIEIDPETLIFYLPFSPLPRSHPFPSGPEGLNFLEACGPQSISGSCDGPWRSVSSLGPSRCCFLLSFLLETVGCSLGEMSGPVKILPQPLTLSQLVASCQARKPNPSSIHTHRLFPKEARTT